MNLLGNFSINITVLNMLFESLPTKHFTCTSGHSYKNRVHKPEQKIHQPLSYFAQDL